MSTRTDKVPNTSATAASSGSDLNGAAVVDACLQIKSRLASVAAAVLDCEPSDVQFESGVVSARGRSIAFAALCETAYKQRVPLFAEGFYRTPDIHFDFKTAPRQAVPLLRLRCGGLGGRGGRVYRPVSCCCGRISCRTSAIRFRRSSIADRSKAASCRAWAGSRSKSCCGTRKGRVSYGRRVHLQAAVMVGGARRSSTSTCSSAPRQAGRRHGQQGGGRAAADAGHLGARSPPRGRRGVRRRRAPCHLRQPGYARARLFRRPARPFRARSPAMIRWNRALPRDDLPHARESLSARRRRSAVARLPRRRRAARRRRPHRRVRRLRRCSGRASRCDDDRLARRVPASGLRRHARALSSSAHHRRAGPDAARLARARRAARRGADGRPRYAADTARAFLRALASHGTTTALVFGAHFASATAALFEAAAASGLANRVRPGRLGSPAAPRASSRHRSEAYRESAAAHRRVITAAGASCMP